MVKRSSAPWTVTDGRAGNVRQAVALASALRQGTHRPLVLQPRAPWRWLSPRRLPGDVNGYGDALATLAADAPALAIGCGRQAAGALRVLRARGSQVVQILDPRIGARHWDVVVVPEHDALRGSNVLTLIGSLNPVDDDWLAWGRAAFASFSTLPGPQAASQVQLLPTVDAATHTAQLRVAQLCTGLTARVLYHYQGQALWLLSFTGVSDDDSARAVLVAALQDWLGFFASHAPWDELCERYRLIQMGRPPARTPLALARQWQEALALGLTPDQGLSARGLQLLPQLLQQLQAPQRCISVLASSAPLPVWPGTGGFTLRLQEVAMPGAASRHWRWHLPAANPLQGDVLAALDGVSRRRDVDTSRLALAGWSHGGWGIMEAMSSDRAAGQLGVADPGAVPLDGVIGTWLAYPYVGIGAFNRMRPWRHCPKVLAVTCRRDHLTTVRNAECEQKDATLGVTPRRAMKSR
mgnify:CR=1 FL=1